MAAPPDPGRPLYVLRLEEAVRQLDKLVASEGLKIMALYPEDHGLDAWVAELVEDLREEEA